VVGNYEGKAKANQHESLTDIKKRKLKNLDTENYPSFVANCLSNFVRYNKKLQHLDLTNTGLSQQVLIDILPGLKRSKSLLAFHLGSNPGIVKTLQKHWRKNLKCKPKEAKNVINVAKDDNKGKALGEVVVESPVPIRETERDQLSTSRWEITQEEDEACGIDKLKEAML